MVEDVLEQILPTTRVESEQRFIATILSYITESERPLKDPRKIRKLLERAASVVYRSDSSLFRLQHKVASTDQQLRIRMIQYSLNDEGPLTKESLTFLDEWGVMDYPNQCLDLLSDYKSYLNEDPILRETANYVLVSIVKCHPNLFGKVLEYFISRKAWQSDIFTINVLVELSTLPVGKGIFDEYNLHSILTDIKYPEFLDHIKQKTMDIMLRLNSQPRKLLE